MSSKKNLHGEMKLPAQRAGLPGRKRVIYSAPPNPACKAGLAGCAPGPCAPFPAAFEAPSCGDSRDALPAKSHRKKSFLKIPISVIGEKPGGGHLGAQF